MTDRPDDKDARQDRRGPIHEYAGGEVSTYAGIVNRWLLVVYAILAVWAVYYLIAYWSGE
jgi:hypothetical protein